MVYGSLVILFRCLGHLTSEDCQAAGYLGTSPVRVDIPNPTGLRMPSGNVPGANGLWIPGGYTSGGIMEAIINPVNPEQYNIKPIN